MSPEILVSAFVALFVIIDPIGTAPLFLALTADRTAAQRRAIAFRSVLIATLVLLAFAVVGMWLLGAMGITLAAFRVAGGLLMFWISFQMVFEKPQPRPKATGEKAVANEPHEDIAAVPLAVPLMAGPGSITAVILLASPLTGEPIHIVYVIGIVGAVMAVTLAIMLLAVPIDRLMGQTVRMVITRLLGVLLAALSVQFVADGIGELRLLG